jgi:hypothetical protein
MATAKKPAPKKTTAKKPAAKAAPVAKKAPVKKAPVKKTAAKKSTKASSKYKSFKVAANQSSFSTFKVTRQTIYWVILIGFIIFAQLWILKLQIDVAGLLDAQQAELMAE